ncbi:MAG TPA: LysE family translocator [Stellaceae bacterium]|jgi:threonine/homoserine/homoserine lactone efflux protein|nr:LysE family translocator [Stellaceae bacterium]
MTIAQSLVAFTVAALLMAMTPGLDTALVLRVAAIEGTRRAVLATLGIASGCLVWGAAVALGLGMLMAQSAVAFGVVKLAGATYLAWLGLGMLLRPRSAMALPEGMEAGKGSSRTTWFWKGLFSNLLNPKVGVFYLSFLPQFVPQGVATGPFTMLLAAIHAGLGFGWCCCLAMATQPLARLLRRPRVMRWLDRVTGCVFLAFGARLVLARQ